MTKSEAVKFYGSMAALGRAIGRTRNAVFNYAEKLPRGVQFEIYVKSQGQLQVDKEFLGATPKP